MVVGKGGALRWSSPRKSICKRRHQESDVSIYLAGLVRWVRSELNKHEMR